MIRKKDLSKQFELVVQQEIVEHNKAIASYRKDVNDLKDDMLKNRDKISDVLTYAENVRVSRDISLDVYKKVVEENIQKVTKDLSSFKTEFKYLLSDYKESIENKLCNFVDKKDLADLKKMLYDRIDELSKTVNTHISLYLCEKREFKASLDVIYHKIDTIINNIVPKQKKEIENLYKKDLESIRVDKECLLKEIAILKKNAFIQEKKIENLYTLIERMKKK